jgi:uncharacterized membrane protein YphA (DoxX/SURF4 family)
MGNVRQIRCIHGNTQLVLTAVEPFFWPVGPNTHSASINCDEIRLEVGPAAPTLAIVATSAETVLGILLLLGWQTRTTALLSGGLLLLFAITMSGALGIKAPLDASVFSAAGGAFLLASGAEYPFSIDQLRRDSARGA